MPREIYRDTGALTGVHAACTLKKLLVARNVDFEVFDVSGRLIQNLTDSSYGICRNPTGYNRHTDSSTLEATLVGGARNAWKRGDRWKIFLTSTEDKIISSTTICKKSGFAAPLKQLVDGELPSERDIDQETMTTVKRK